MPDTEGDNSQEGSALNQEQEFSQHTYVKAVHYSLRSIKQRAALKFYKEGRHFRLSGPIQASDWC